MTASQTIDFKDVIADWEAIMARAESGETITISVGCKAVGQLVPPENQESGEQAKIDPATT